MKAFYFIIIILLSASCQKDSIVRGNVFDNNNFPLENVKVLVNSSDIYTLTDADGYFEIDPNGLSKELLFDKDGFELKFIPIPDENKLLKVILEEKTEGGI
jgi:hypothetical protein